MQASFSKRDDEGKEEEKQEENLYLSYLVACDIEKFLRLR